MKNSIRLSIMSQFLSAERSSSQFAGLLYTAPGNRLDTPCPLLNPATCSLASRSTTPGKPLHPLSLPNIDVVENLYLYQTYLSYSSLLFPSCTYLLDNASSFLPFVMSLIKTLISCPRAMHRLAFWPFVWAIGCKRLDCSSVVFSVESHPPKRLSIHNALPFQKDCSGVMF